MDIQNNFDAAAFIQAVGTQNVPVLRSFFADDAVINWHDSNESFTADEYVRANCEYPGDWQASLKQLEVIDGGVVIVAKVSSAELSVYVVSFAKLVDGKIARLDEYYSICGEAPQWRRDMSIGRPIIN